MYTITEAPSKKLPCLTSLFFTLDGYNKKLFDTLIQTPDVVFDKKTSTFELPINTLYFVVNTLTVYGDVTFKPYKQKLKKEVSCKNRSFLVKPYKHQMDGINYGLNHDSWLLLDDQGLGKTLQMIYLAEELHRTEKLEHCLIICGVNSLKYNWASEIEKFSKLSYTILGQYTTKTGKVRQAPVKSRCEQLEKKIKEFFVIVNIETLQNDEFIKSYNKSKNKFDMIVLDEAHKCKQPTTLSAKTLLKLKAKRKIALTGTVIINNPENSYVPLKWTDNTKSTFSQFKHMFNVYGGFGNVQVIGHKNLNLLQELLSSCSLRRLKTDVLDLPSKIYSIEYVEMGSKQQALYDEVSEGILAELDKLEKKPTIVQELTINMRLRQITACPSLLTTDTISSAKLDRLEELVENITSQGDKVVIFSTFKGTIDEIARRLSKYEPVVCTGDTSDADIAINKKIFEQSADCRAMVCTWQKMGTGHTLTAANYAIFVDTPWTDADFKQCSDRIYRIGQTKPVFIITLITKNTYDERVQEILEHKECLSNYLIDNGDASAINIFGEG